MGSVYAFRSELEAWANSRKLRAAEDDASASVALNPPFSPRSPATSKSSTGSRLVWILMAAALLIGGGLWLRRTEYFWRNPIANVRFQTVTDFGGVARDAAVSRDGHFIAFLSDRDGQMDVWVTQAGSGEFHNLTHGNTRGLGNPLVRTLGFSPDGSLVTFWIRRQDGSSGGEIGVWAVPVLGGQPRPYLEGVAEYDWSRDGTRLAYHTPGSGDPLFVSSGGRRLQDRPILTAPAGLHSHFQLWAPDLMFFCPRLSPRKLGHLAHRSDGRNSRENHFAP